MEHVSAADPAAHGGNHLLVENRHRHLLLLAHVGRASVIATPELVDAHELQDVEIPPRDAFVPRLRSAARDGDDPFRSHRETADEPLQERYPVQKLETNLAEPPARDDPPIARGNTPN